MLYAIVGISIALASFIFAMLELGGGMVYVPVINWDGFDMKEVAIPLGLLLNEDDMLYANCICFNKLHQMDVYNMNR